MTETSASEAPERLIVSWSIVNSSASRWLAPLSVISRVVADPDSSARDAPDSSMLPPSIDRAGQPARARHRDGHRVCRQPIGRRDRGRPRTFERLQRSHRDVRLQRRVRHRRSLLLADVEGVARDPDVEGVNEVVVDAHRHRLGAPDRDGHGERARHRAW